MKALVVVDMQNDFMPWGALGVPNADRLIPRINALMEKYPLVVATKDWHPPHHMSFEFNWPVHCVQETEGAEFTPGLHFDKFEKTFYKGVDADVDSYSAFFDNEKKRSTGLGEYLKKKGVNEVTIVGVATDYCVLYSTLDALQMGFKVRVIKEACAPINLKPDDEAKAYALMLEKGAIIE